MIFEYQLKQEIKYLRKERKELQKALSREVDTNMELSKEIERLNDERKVQGKAKTV